MDVASVEMGVVVSDIESKSFLEAIRQVARPAEMVELTDQTWFVEGQFHPELKSRPNRAHPLFRDFVGAGRGIPGGRKESRGEKHGATVGWLRTENRN